MKNLILLLVLLVLAQVTKAEVEFFYFESESFKQELQQEIEGLQEFLKDQITFPQDVLITYRPTVGTSFDIKKGVLNIATTELEAITHEFAHQIFDTNLFEQSPVWFYYKARESVRFSDLGDSIKNLKKSIAHLDSARRSFISQGNHALFPAIDTRKTQYEKELSFLEEAFQYDRELKDVIEKTNTFRRLVPYQEFFADTLSIIYYNDWNIMHETVFNVTGNPVVAQSRKYESSPSVIASYLDPYTHFAKSRSWLRNHFQSPRDISVPCLTSAVISAYERDLRSLDYAYSYDEINLNFQEFYTSCVK